MTVEKLNELQGDMLENPRLSLRRLAQQCNVGYGTAQRAVKDHLKLKPYKIHVVHELLPEDHQARLHYCDWIVEVINHEEEFLDYCFFCVEVSIKRQLEFPEQPFLELRQSSSYPRTPSSSPQDRCLGSHDQEKNIFCIL
jgi:hypothetical protein